MSPSEQNEPIKKYAVAGAPLSFSTLQWLFIDLSIHDSKRESKMIISAGTSSTSILASVREPGVDYRATGGCQETADK